MASLVDSLLADPNFQSAPPPVQQRALFRAGSPDERQAFLNTVDQQYGLPTGTLHGIATVESGVNPDVQDGKAGERGMFQFMPETGAQYGLTPENFTDPLEQVRAAGEFMQANMAQTGGDLPAALALYNGDPAGRSGPYANKVLAAMGKGGVEVPTLGRSLSLSLGRGEQSVESGLRNIAANPRMLLRMTEGPAGLAEATRAGTVGDVANVAAPVLAPGAAAAGVGAETVARQLGSTEQTAQRANTIGQVSTAAAPMALSAAGEALSLVPGVGRSIYRAGFSPEAISKYETLAKTSDFPRGLAGKFLPYFDRTSGVDDLTLLKRAQSGDSRLLAAFGHIVKTGLGGLAGHLIGGHEIMGAMLGEPTAAGLVAALRGALTNPLTRPMVRQLLSSAATSGDYGRLATVLVSQLAGSPTSAPAPFAPGATPP